MIKKKEVEFLQLFSKKPRKNLHLTQKFVKNFCTLVEKTKRFFASCKKVKLNFCRRDEKIKPKLASCEKNSELIFAHVLKITYLIVEKTFDTK